ncbi:hypothetical protein GUJ93_ZPchr0012g21116 [Zizania palustris]|uniref:Uncharacterized protein n=1 Tax=Zizania palustris TaxID=103762 RepID=A0A8J5WP10_ZIZPA|nr:hypothetical protein GUJ93_ZPchr0012g21116 [Zizania palustris]
MIRDSCSLDPNFEGTTRPTHYHIFHDEIGIGSLTFLRISEEHYSHISCGGFNGDYAGEAPCFGLECTKLFDPDRFEELWKELDGVKHAWKNK